MEIELRHDLGKYYTPDWLVEFLIDEVDKYALSEGRDPIESLT